ncbi:hypothetical protein HPB48_019843 [Haemaphysalis longicornis]|uniref:Uncharacterized protein n=1 Tax=Haemaphysalis longicornis TaxID=44386 RepID=A0A9J6FBV0_HAELO|nr:hypothetical protein HPB48_019843 [Haemaphysalis longicornis]
MAQRRAATLLFMLPLALTAAPGSNNHVLLDRLQEVLDSPTSHIGVRCRNDTLFYLDRLRGGAPWALKSKSSASR